MLVEFVLHGPSSAFPCVTNDYAPYKQQVLFAVLRLYATDPRVCDEAAAAAGNGAERAPYAGQPHTAHPQTSFSFPRFLFLVPLITI